MTPPIKVTHGFDSICDFCKGEISRMQPHVVMFSKFKIHRKCCESFLCEIKELDMLQDKKFSNIRIKYSDTSHECNRCGKSSEGGLLISKINKISLNSYKSICKDCLVLAIKDLESYIDKNENDYLFWDSSGFCIKNTYSRFTLYSSNEHEESKDLIVIGTDNKIYVLLDNLETLVDELQTIKTADHSYSRRHVSCYVCGDADKKILPVNGTKGVCNSCRYNLIDSIEEFSENNTELIASRLI